MMDLKLARNNGGAAAIEMALILPMLILFLYGIVQVGLIMAANAGMQHALGEGARVATLYPTPADSVIKNRMGDRMFGMFIGGYVIADPQTNSVSVSVPSTIPGEAATIRTTNLSKDLAITYTVTPNFLFFTAPQLTFNRTKRVYLSF